MASPVSPAAGTPVPIVHVCDVRSAPMQDGAVPNTKGSRLIGVDAARGIALLGMFAVHVLYPVGADGGRSLAHTLAAGKSAAMFAVIAGVGIAFLTGGRHPPVGRARTAAAAALTVRALAIGLLGLALGYASFDTVGVILAFYAVLFVLAIPLIGLRPRVLLLLGFAIALVGPVLSHVVRSALPAPSGANPSFAHLFRDPISQIVELMVTGLYPALPWAAYFCFGLAAGRSRLWSLRVAAGLLGGGAALAVCASFTSWLLLHPLGGLDRIATGGNGLGTTAIDEILFEGYGATPTSTVWWLAINSPHSSTPPDLLYTTGVAYAVLGITLMFARGAASLLTPLAAVGSMTLTLYAAHVVVLTSPFLPRNESASLVLQTTLALLFALAWRRHMPRGPLEEIIARLAARTRRRVLSTPARRRLT